MPAKKLRTRLSTAAGRQDGLTAIELMVTVILLGVVGAVTTAGVITALEAQRRQVARVTATTEMNTAFERVTRDLRAANLVLAEPQRMRFTVDDYVNGVERTLDYQLAAGGTQLVLDETVEDSATGALTALPQVIILEPLSVGANPIFRWYQSDGTELLAPVDIRDVASIDMLLTVVLPENGGDLNLSNEITLRNAGS